MKALALALTSLLAAALAPRAHAYLDPASGSMLLQLIVLLIPLLLIVGLYALVRSRRRKRALEDEDEL